VIQIKQVLRGLWRYKSFTVINFLGLSIGIAAIAILYLIAIYENSFDRLHSQDDKIYRLVAAKEIEGKTEEEATVPYPTAKFLRNEYAGVVATQIHFERDKSIQIGSQPPFSEKNMVFADSMFFRVLDFSRIPGFWVRGTAYKALDAPRKAVLTESTARKYFGDADPIGKTFRLDNKADIEVVGVVKDIPATSHLPVNLFISYSTMDSSYIGGLSMDSWNFVSNGYCYVKLSNEKAGLQVVDAMKRIVLKNTKNERLRKQVYSIQPISDIHFNQRYEDSNPNYTVSRKYLDMLLLLGGFIILIACVNYINLSTSLAFAKAKEVGIRKTIGASAKQLFVHYFSETLLVTSIAAIIGIGITILALPQVNRMMDKSISLDQLVQVRFILVAIAGIIIISLVSGVYPALILSGFNPITSLKNQLMLPGRSSGWLRKVLVVFQFTTSIALIICTFIIGRQVNYFNNKPLGFNKDAVVEVGLPEADSAKRENLRARLQNVTGINALSFCIGAPISDNNLNTSMQAPELSPGTEYSIQVIACDENYRNTYGIRLAAGRWFLPGEEKNLGTAVVINEATARTLGYKNPADAVGRHISIGINKMNPAIVGVTNDFHTNSLHEAIKPVGMLPFPYFYYAAAIRINANNMRKELAVIESAWRSIFPESVYSVNFIDEALAKKYQQENRDYHLFEAFSAISIFICCIGLWGLIAFVVVRKTKEIGIRKVLGATITSIVGLLSKDFLKLVLVAMAVASPIAWYFMNRWLNNFAYRINMSWWIFLLAGAVALLIALITISVQAIKAALANPVKNLRTE
jgi:putative ABC transport system permease protein